jgi:RND family efflux transporter MFP subunit
MTRFNRLILLAGLVAGAGYLFAIGAFRPLPGWLGGEATIAVRVVPVRKAAGPRTVRLSGELEPVREVKVVSPIAGGVTEVRFKAGDMVRAGAIVATIHSSTLVQRIADQEAAVAAAEQDLHAKAGRFDDAQKQLAKYRELHKRDLIARREVAEAESKAETAGAQVEFARAQLTQQQAMLAQARALRKVTSLTAPFDGVVTRRLVEPGAFVAESGPILILADSASLKLIAKVEGEVLADIYSGLPVEIFSPQAPDQTLAGKVVRVDALTEDHARRAQVEIHASIDKETFRAGMAATAQIQLDSRQETLWVPSTAVISTEGTAYVYLFSAGKALQREVAIGAELNGDVEIKNGLAEGDLVILDNLDVLKPGSQVRPSVKLEPRATP